MEGSCRLTSLNQNTCCLHHRCRHWSSLCWGSNVLEIVFQLLRPNRATPFRNMKSSSGVHLCASRLLNARCRWMQRLRTPRFVRSSLSAIAFQGFFDPCAWWWWCSRYRCINSTSSSALQSLVLEATELRYWPLNQLKGVSMWVPQRSCGTWSSKL